MIIKKSKSGKALLITDDFGNTYSTSIAYVTKYLLDPDNKLRFLTLTRFPKPATVDRFPKSPVLGPENEHIPEGDPRWFMPQCPHSTLEDNQETDGFGRQTLKKKEEKKTFEDKVIW